MARASCCRESSIRENSDAMKAVVCRAFGAPENLVVEDVPSPEPGPGEVVVRIGGAGVNFPDGLLVRGLYQIRPEPPFTPGFEGAGVVTRVGDGVTGIRPGTRVVTHPFMGTFAEEVVAEARRVFPIPDALDDVTGAGFLIPYGTSFHALDDRAGLKAGETLLVLGAAGGLGLAAVELGKLMGARVIAAASSDEKLALCREYGADGLVNYTTEDLRQRVRELTEGRGPDVVFDPVGGPYTEPMLRSLARYGRYIVVGFASGEIAKVPVNLILLKRSAMVGLFWGPSLDDDNEAAHRDVAALLDWYTQGKLKPHISRVYPLEQVAEAIRHVEERKVLGKVVLKVGAD
jgi:NADPH2:quinone reductase